MAAEDAAEPQRPAADLCRISSLSDLASADGCGIFAGGMSAMEHDGMSARSGSSLATAQLLSASSGSDSDSGDSMQSGLAGHNPRHRSSRDATTGRDDVGLGGAPAGLRSSSRLSGLNRLSRALPTKAGGTQAPPNTPSQPAGTPSVRRHSMPAVAFAAAAADFAAGRRHAADAAAATDWAARGTDADARAAPVSRLDTRLQHAAAVDRSAMAVRGGSGKAIAASGAQTKGVNACR